jgi:hypothetical protein
VTVTGTARETVTGTLIRTVRTGNRLTVVFPFFVVVTIFVTVIDLKATASAFEDVPPAVAVIALAAR